MFNDLFEDWLVKCLGIDFADQFQSNNECFRSFMSMWISRIGEWGEMVKLGA